MKNNFRVFKLDEKATVKENCDVMIKRVHEIQAIGVLVDMIISAIVGYFERDELEKTLKEYETALAEFRPASEQYQDAITEVKIMLKCSKK
ncbi:Single-pass membrane and coiled-coil domain-containing protein 3 [Anabarilius grahami]|uniref:Single-pass membrane and coiled-coil domain-containing protein 3 n=1 Tax=Anabarilius grahami TaxID=495550 RepID=A0A3N0XN66_ANAGA|nr:Single-pass membrane and coiled-coil domain-containing protein 3 [Anabarilius grahami]